jgi:two-component system, NtrC family, sensor histidine kinase HydH
LGHLVRNAREAMNDQKAERVLRVESKWLEEYSQFQITISDTGPGIPLDQQYRIFHRRFDRNKNGHGGLGLMLVYFLIKTISGSIRTLPSQPKWGATFVIRLPLQPLSMSNTDLEVSYGSTVSEKEHS